MKEYEAVIIGSGCGMNVVDEALAHGLETALVDRGPLGGTCPNLGCIPSKMLIFAADRIAEVRESKKLGVEAEINNIDFDFIMGRMRKFVRENQENMRHSLTHIEELGFFKGEGRFTSEYTLEVNGEEIRGEKIFIASGARPFIPPVKGLDGVDYLTNETLLQLRERPESLIIIGGGYIAVEYGHFFAAMGTKVTILEMADRLILAEEPEISDVLKKELSLRMEVYTGVRAEEVRKSDSRITVTVNDLKKGGTKEYTAQKLLVAVGRKSNADLLQAEKTDVKIDEKGYISVDEHLETGKNNIYAIGDANGRHMFTHVGNRESMLAAHNAIHGSKVKMDYSAAPHAVYSHPQIASVGLTEENARQKTHKLLVGRAQYFDVAKGEAMLETSGFAKVIADAESEKILGFHIIGPYAPILIQEVTNIMSAGGNIDHLQAGMHIHPAMSELIPRTLANMEEA